MDKVFLNMPINEVLAKPPTRRAPPSWLKEGASNLRGLVPPSDSHYMALIGLG